MSGPRPLLSGVPDPERPAADILTATAAATGLPAAVVLDRAIRAWASLVAAAEAGELLWVGRPDADHLDRLTFNTHLSGSTPTAGRPTAAGPTAGPSTTDCGAAGTATAWEEDDTATH